MRTRCLRKYHSRPPLPHTEFEALLHHSAPNQTMFVCDPNIIVLFSSSRVDAPCAADQVCATLHLHVFVGVEGTGLGARVSGEVQVAEPDWEEDHVFPPQTFGVLTARRLPLLPDIALHTRKSRCTIKLFQVQHAGTCLTVTILFRKAWLFRGVDCGNNDCQGLVESGSSVRR